MEKNQKKVLIVDDSLLVMERMITLLEEIDGIAFVVQACSFSEGITAFDMLDADLVLLDISLPDGSGMDLLRLFRKKKPNMPVLMITNHTEELYLEACRKLGARHILDKSIDLDLLPGVLSAICHQQ